jgi:hypothetical protein
MFNSFMFLLDNLFTTKVTIPFSVSVQTNHRCTLPQQISNRGFRPKVIGERSVQYANSHHRLRTNDPDCPQGNVAFLALCWPQKSRPDPVTRRYLARDALSTFRECFSSFHSNDIYSKSYVLNDGRTGRRRRQ